jgi:hypothetical protein
MSQGFNVPADSLAFERRPLPQKILSQVVPGVAAVCVMALACAAALHLGAGGAQRGAKLQLAASQPARSQPKASANPYGVLVDPGFVIDTRPAWLDLSLSLQAHLDPIPPAHPPEIATAPSATENVPETRQVSLETAAPLPPPRPSEFGALASLPAPVRRSEPPQTKAADAAPPADNRTFIQKLLGLPARGGAALAYAEPEGAILRQTRPAESTAIPQAHGGVTGPSARYDPYTAVYDISAHTVYLPNGARLEAHSGQGEGLDNLRLVSERMRGPTPPDLYELSPREQVFHGVQALRLKPIGKGDLFGRAGLLAHSYMLGPNGDSFGCVSFKDYDAFLQAYKSGQIKRLAVVARLD